MSWLKQSTAVTIVMPPMLDSTDGNTPETGLTISQADIRLSKNGGAYAQTNNVAGATHMEVGNYSVPLDTTDTATLGTLRVSIHESGALAVWREFTIITANVFDSIVLSTDKLQTDVRQWKGTDTSVPDVAGIPNINITHLRGTYLSPTVAGVLETNVTHLLDTAWLTPGVAGTPDVNAKLLGGTSQTGNDVGGDVNTILSDTNELQTDWTNGGRLDLILDIIAADTTTDIPALIATAQTDLDTITGTDGVTLATAQALYAPNKVVPDVAGTASTLHGITDGKVDTVDTNVDAILLDTGTTIPGTITTLQTDSTAIKAKTDNLPDGIKKNTAITAFTFLMVDSTDHVTAKTGLTVAGNYSGDGGAVAALTNTGAITEISNGLYEIDLTSGELNYENVTLIFTSSGADARVITIHTST